DDVEQRRLAGAVRADDAEAFAPVEREVERGEQVGPVAEAVCDAVQLDDLVAESRRALEQQGEVAVASGRGGWRRAGLDGTLDARLGLAGARRRATAQPRQLGAREVATRRFGDRGLLLPVGARREVTGVPTVVDEAAAAVELEHPGGEAVEHVAVVGDE